jgi:hypothetical protein
MNGTPATLGPVPTEDQRRRICDLAKAHWTTGEIVEALGIPVHTVKRVRAAAGLADPKGRPATGQRERVNCRLDDDVIVQVDANVERDGVARHDVLEQIVTAWARGESLPARARR